jgi:hypothetical protein
MANKIKDKCPFCSDGYMKDGQCGKCYAYAVITEGDDANYDCSFEQIKKGMTNKTKPKRK